MSRLVPVTLLLVALLAPSLFAQGGTAEPAEHRIRPLESLRQLTVKLTEYELPSPAAQITSEITTSNDLTPVFEKLRKEDKLRQTSEITFRAMEHQSTSVQFGEQIGLLRATSRFQNQRAGTAYHHASVGTLISVQWTQHEDQLALKLNYDQSFPSPGPTEDAPATIKTMTINTTVSVKPGELMLVSSKNTEGKMLLLTLSVTPHD